MDHFLTTTCNKKYTEFLFSYKFEWNKSEFYHISDMHCKVFPRPISSASMAPQYFASLKFMMQEYRNMTPSCWCKRSTLERKESNFTSVTGNFSVLNFHWKHFTSSEKAFHIKKMHFTPSDRTFHNIEKLRKSQKLRHSAEVPDGSNQA